MANIEVGRRFLEEPDEVELDGLTSVLCEKIASAEDEDLLRIAVDMPGDTADLYEALGGTYKVAAMPSLKGIMKSFSKTKAPKAPQVMGPPAAKGLGVTPMKQHTSLFPAPAWAGGKPQTGYKKQAAALRKKLAFGTPMFQMNPIQMAAPAAGGAPAGPTMKPATAGMKAPGAGKPGMGMQGPGQGGGGANPMQMPSVAKTPGAGGEKTGAVSVKKVRAAAQAASPERLRKFHHAVGSKAGKGHQEAAEVASKVRDERGLLRRTAYGLPSHPENFPHPGNPFMAGR